MTSNQRAIVSFVLLLLTTNPPLSATPLSESLRGDVGILAADEMEGRGLGTRGLERASAWIASRMRQIGLEPGFRRDFMQPFQIKTGVALADGNELSGVSGADWTPLGFSSSGTFEGELAFAGYGIEAPAIGYRELDGLDLKGKVVLMLRYEPQERDDASPFDGRRPSRWSSMRYKTLQARERGAVAVIFVTGPLQDEEKDKLPALKNDGPESAAGIPVLQVKSSVAQSWLGRQVNLLTFQQQVERDLTPRSLSSTGARIVGRVNLRSTHDRANNVVGIIRGRGRLANEVVVLGAHYDHLGFGGQHSMRPNERAVHNGADDNASGTVAVLRAAEMLRSSLRSSNNHRTVAIALFAGEEVGLAGSSHLVSHFPLPIDRVVAMINLDMVGRLRDRQLLALGTESAAEWESSIRKEADALQLAVVMRGDGYGPSDQTSFYSRQIPVLHFFTGAHDAYHTPDDDTATINFEGLETVTRFTAAVISRIADGSLTPHYARASSVPLMEGDSRGYGAYLGTIPDYRAMEGSGEGVLLGDVRKGGPADLAGIRGGDTIVEMAGTRIANLHDMTFALQDHKPGETITVVVLRGGESVSLRATLGSRQDRNAPAPSSPPAQPAAAPHSQAPTPQPSSASGFYSDRPGKDFEVRAGKPYAEALESEKHLTNIRQLTFGGENAEAYFSPDGTKLIYQATTQPDRCDQQFILDLATGESRRVSSGKGRTTCGYFDWPEMDRIIYASTEAAGDECPPAPDRTQGYVWAIYDSYDLYEAKPDGSSPHRLTTTPGYDAEATWCHRGGKLVFTSTRDGDLDLYEMNEAGDVRRLTNTPGYDGGAFFSPDCSEIVWRASRPTGEALADYQQLLRRGLVRPTALEIFVMKSDGTDVRQVTTNGAANFCPYFHPDGERIIFASNAGSQSGREFDLWITSKKGGDPQRVTFAAGFDGFPMFSPDGTWIVWASNRANPAGRDTNLFIARWSN